MNTQAFCYFAVIAALITGKAAVAGEKIVPKSAQFDVRHELKVKVPEGAQRVRIWFALPQDVNEQKIKNLKIESVHPHHFKKDSEGNELLYVELKQPHESELTILTTFSLTRKEVRKQMDAEKAKPLSESERTKMTRYLQSNANIVIDDNIRKLAKEIVGDENNPVRAARKLYDWVLANVDYWVKDPATRKASPVGSSEYCLSSKTGNCTDFHSLWTALARASDIPTRMVYGSFFKAELDGKDVDQSYHCWPEFYVTGIGWIPHDVAVADIFVGDFKLNKDNEVLVARTTADGYKGAEPAKIDYYFGNIDERRVTWSIGRDLILNPKQDGGPVNALPKAYLEIDGKIYVEKDGWTRKLTYIEKKSR